MSNLYLFASSELATVVPVQVLQKKNKKVCMKGEEKKEKWRLVAVITHAEGLRIVPLRLFILVIMSKSENKNNALSFLVP